jgi:type IV secretory pathway ATPase VirB11/archaellum biosynthesis ATPase
MNELKLFTFYETVLKESIKEYILNKQDFATFEELLTVLFELSKNGMQISEQNVIPVLFRTLNMEKLGPLLLDDRIDEIYLDSGEETLYIDHAQFGRCQTHIRLSKKDVTSFVHRVALENDFSLNRENPTMKGDFVSQFFHTRVTIDTPPLLIDDIHLDIRKFHPHNLRLTELVELGSLSHQQSELLKFFIQNLVSISVIGPPNSGKTTMQNALLEFLPPHFRVLSIEDVLETSTLRKGKQVRFRLGYDHKDSSIYSKAMEIQKILHRSPDFVNLGELSTKDHFLAFLNILSVSIPSIQTIHGKNTEHLLLRLKDIYEIPIGLINNSFPHIFIELTTTWMNHYRNRRIYRIIELTSDGKLNDISDFNSLPIVDSSNQNYKSDTIEYVNRRVNTVF